MDSSAIGLLTFSLFFYIECISAYSYYRGSTCRDRVANCNQLRGYNWCRYYATYMSTNCRRTCGFCRPTVSQSTCIDRHRNCASWARSGQCRKNPRYMIPYCPRSCGQCQRVQVVNGNWGSWSAPSTCSKSCGGGIQTRYRRCNNPAPKNGGRKCVGISQKTISCNTQSCLKVVNGNWGSWSAPSTCSKSCGGGIQTKYRRCNNPAPKNGGRKCVGISQKTISCNTQSCLKVVNGGWSSWGSYSSCSKSCGPGIKTRHRQCNNPAPQNGGKQCVGKYQHSERCKIKDCLKAINGNWGSWTSSLCSVSCGSGIQSRVRRCDNPPPQNGGKQCDGKSREVVRCNTEECPTAGPIDGKWSNWGTWTECTRTCNGGYKSRFRECDNPFPSNGGQWCDGFYAERVACNTQRCKAKISLPVFTCGVRRVIGRIVGGSVADTRDWPWQAGLKRGRENSIYCGGSLINREWVLTAAHCIYGLDPSRTGCVKPEPSLRVVLGEFDVNNRDGHEVHIDVAQVCMHPNYEHRTLDYDVALLRLASPVMNFNQYIRPVCMPSNSYAIPIGQNCSVTGFGKIGEVASVSNKLRHAKVPVKPLNYCKSQYPTRLVTGRMICAGYEGGQIDSCKGDSGGPFVCPDPKDKSRFVLAGAVSWGVGCARPGQPGLYTNIKYFLPWIKRILKNN